MTILSAAISTVGATSMTVTSAATFPAALNYRIRIDNEFLIVTGGAGTTTWTITRGAEGSTAATHANGATVYGVLTAAGLAHPVEQHTHAGGTEGILLSGSLFGDGSDGTGTITSGTTTLTRDYFYNNLTINSGGILVPDGYRVYVKGTFTNNGSIVADGLVGGNGAAGSSGADATARSSAGPLGAGAAGYANISLSIGGGGGHGGDAYGYSGGSGGTASYAATSGSYRSSTVFSGFTTAGLLPINGGGGGGAGGRNVSGFQGGGAGGGGGVIVLCANVFDNTSGIISAVGGQGGNAYYVNTTDYGGVGGGGGGGAIWIVYKTYTAAGTQSVAGGAIGTTTGGSRGVSSATAGATGTITLIAV